MEPDPPYNSSLYNITDEYTEVKASGIEGYGLYARKPIPKGTVWWYARPQDVLVVEKDQFLTLVNSFRPPLPYKPQLVERFLSCLLTYSYYDADMDALIFSLDNARYVNHSSNANSAPCANKFSSMAIRDIQTGDEITEDYSKYAKSNWATLKGSVYK